MIKKFIPTLKLEKEEGNENEKEKKIFNIF